jgi:hypothetical protein
MEPGDGETTVSLRWIAARFQAGSWKSLAAKLHRWRKTHDAPDNASRFYLTPLESKSAAFGQWNV